LVGLGLIDLIIPIYQKNALFDPFGIELVKMEVLKDKWSTLSLK
jgi:hypothetical protein